MRYYGKFNLEGFAEAFFVSDINEEIPNDAVELTKEQYNTLVENQHEKAFVDGGVVDKSIIYDYEYIRMRKSEYPTIEECVHALLDGGETYEALKDARAAVKAKYPKP